MKQRHSYHALLYHLVFSTKQRLPLIENPAMAGQLEGFIELKAHQLDCYLLEFGAWRDHVHLLLKTGVCIALSDLYGQLKGFAAHAWRKQHPEKLFNWQDGVFCHTVNPKDTGALRLYIREQWQKHEHQRVVQEWEPMVK